MGRHSKRPTNTGKIVKSTSVNEAMRNDAVMDRMGLLDLICMKCNAHNDKRANKCRKCGYTQLRKKALDYRD